VTSSPADHAPGLERLFDRVPEEVSCRLEPSLGEIPVWLRGSYYANGPARFTRGGQAYRHWLDGDGLVMALHFDPMDGDGPGPRYVTRFVRSAKFEREEAEDTARFRTFGTAFDGDELLRGVALASPVNVSVYPHAGRLLAFGEQGLPWELDPETLETVGEHTFGRRLNPISPFSAHPGFDSRDGEMVNFGVSFAADRPTLNLYRISSEGEVLSRRRAPLPYPASIHDFGLSPRFAVFYVNPYLLEMGRFMEGGETVLGCLDWRPELGSLLMVVDRETGETVLEVPAGREGKAGYCLHHVNSFEPSEDRLVVDVLELEEPVYPDYQPVPDLFENVAPSHPVRYVIDLSDQRRGEVIERREVPYELAADFPALAPGSSGQPADEFWMLAISKTGQEGRKFLDRLVRIDLAEGVEADAWQPEAGRYLGNEPVVVGSPDGSELLVMVHELDPAERRSAMVMLDARDLAGGPVVRLPLPGAVAPLFHACFTS
jgi:all-trans-8'-apo-beta-carotenal 15,15'-oxygenase